MFKSLDTFSASAAGQLGKESQFAMLPQCLQGCASSFTSKAGHSPDTNFSTYLQTFQMCAMPLYLMNFVVRPRYDTLDHFLRPAKYFVPAAQDLANTLQAYLPECFDTSEQ